MVTMDTQSFVRVPVLGQRLLELVCLARSQGDWRQEEFVEGGAHM